MPITLLLSPQQLSLLVPVVPAIIAWLRHLEPTNAGDRFLKPDANMEEVQGTLRELLNAANFNNGDLTNVQLRYIFSCHDISIWATAVRVILGECDPKIIPNEVGMALNASLAQVHEADEDDVAKILGASMDQLSRSSFVALGEFCALLRDTCKETQQLACLVGPLLIAPRNAPVSATVSSASAAVMDYLIEEAESVFGRPACYNKKDAMGIRKPMPVLTRRAAAESNAGSSPRVGGGGSDLGLAPPPGLGNLGGSQGGFFLKNKKKSAFTN